MSEQGGFSDEPCGACGAALPSEAITCDGCGAYNPDAARICPDCDQVYPAAFAFCATDGAKLVTPTALPLFQDTAAEADTMADAQPASYSGGFDPGALLQQVGPFWRRHRLLASLTLFALALWGVHIADPYAGFALPVAALTLALLLSWPVALSNSNRLLGFVGHIDNGYFRLVRFFENWDGRIGRWLLYPVVWVGGKWAVFASRNGDRFVAASLRLFGYTIAVMLVAFLAILAVYIFIALVVIALSLWVLGQIFDVDTGDTGFRRKPRIGRREHEIFENDGGFFSIDKRVGRVDRHGNIYEGDGGFFSTDKRVGRIDDDGEMFEGDGGFFSTDKRTGRIDDDGEMFEGDGGFFSTDKRVGRVGKDGKIYKGDGGFFSTDRQVGRSKRRD